MGITNKNILYRSILLSVAWLSFSSFTSTSEGGQFIRHIANVRLDDSNLSSYQKKMYEKDATRLALRYISKGEDYKNISADIPSEVMNELYASLIAVHKSPFNESIEVTKKHRLHTFPNPAVDKFQVNYTNTSKWATPLRLGDNLTDSEIINKLCEEYGLSIESHKTWDDDSNMFIVKAKKAKNLAPIADEFLTESGVEQIRLLIPDSDGNDIEAIRTAKGWKLNYIVKFDSCFTGCKKQHMWSFDITSISSGSANVNFLGEFGDDLPDWMK